MAMPLNDILPSIQPNLKLAGQTPVSSSNLMTASDSGLLDLAGMSPEFEDAFLDNETLKIFSGRKDGNSSSRISGLDLDKKRFQELDQQRSELRRQIETGVFDAVNRHNIRHADKPNLQIDAKGRSFKRLATKLESDNKRSNAVVDRIKKRVIKMYNSSVLDAAGVAIGTFNPRAGAAIKFFGQLAKFHDGKKPLFGANKGHDLLTQQIKHGLRPSMKKTIESAMAGEDVNFDSATAVLNHLATSISNSGAESKEIKQALETLGKSAKHLVGKTIKPSEQKARGKSYYTLIEDKSEEYNKLSQRAEKARARISKYDAMAQEIKEMSGNGEFSIFAKYKAISRQRADLAKSLGLNPKHVVKESAAIPAAAEAKITSRGVVTDENPSAEQAQTIKDKIKARIEKESVQTALDGTENTDSIKKKVRLRAQRNILLNPSSKRKARLDTGSVSSAFESTTKISSEELSNGASSSVSFKAAPTKTRSVKLVNK